MSEVYTRAPEPVINVGFGTHRVRIRSSAPDVLNQLARTFYWMMAPDTAASLGRIDVELKDGRYHAHAPSDAQVTVASARQITRWVQYRVIEMFIDARSDLVWLHGAAAALGDTTVLMPGKRGRGKSSLVAELWKLGWLFLSDDILPFDPVSLHVLPFPQMPAVREPPARQLTEAELGRVPKTELDVTERVAERAMPVSAIVLPDAQRGNDHETDFVPCSKGEVVLALLEGCWNFAGHEERALNRLCSLVPRTSTFSLTFSDAERAAAILTDWAAGKGSLRAE